MYKNNSFLAIIPARGGSKGIPGKNIIEIMGKPLIYYTIHEAKQSSYLDKIIVSTDSQEIAKISLDYGLEAPFMRPAHISKDDSKTIEAVIFTLDKVKCQGEDFDYVVILQPTQPMRKAFHIDEAIELIVNKGAQGLATVSQVKDHPVLIRRIDGSGNLTKLIDASSTVRRQDFTKYYKINGAIYINKIDAVNIETSFNDNELAYLMEDIYDIDIDEPFDLDIFALKYKLQQKKNHKECFNEKNTSITYR